MKGKVHLMELAKGPPEYIEMGKLERGENGLCRQALKLKNWNECVS